MKRPLLLRLFVAFAQLAWYGPQVLYLRWRDARDRFNDEMYLADLKKQHPDHWMVLEPEVVAEWDKAGQWEIVKGEDPA